MSMVNDLVIDKQNGTVAYNDELHKYWNVKNPEFNYTSVTTLIGSYHDEFDEEFWSRKKAMDEILENDPEKLKLFKDMVKTAKKWNKRFNEYFGVSEELLISTSKNIIANWRAINKESTDFGTAYHLKQENMWYEKGGILVKENFKYDGEFLIQKGDYRLEADKAIIPEFLVYYSCPDNIIHLAGQVDLLIKDGNDITIGDFKTNKKGIKKTAFFDQATKRSKTMHFPINNLLDTTYNHYNLQLSIYAWMLQKINPEFNIKLLRLIHVDREENTTQYDVDYLKDDVTRLLRHHKKREILRRRNKDIEFKGF